MRALLRPARTAALVTAAVVVLLGATAIHGVVRNLRAPFDRTTAAYVRSESCVSCHPGRHETWDATFHSSMTQVPSPEAVLGDFDGAEYSWGGVTTRFTREGERFLIDTLDAVDPASGRRTRYEVALTVGSRRVQQYVTRIGDRHFRLPLAWNVEEGRWFHLAGGFLHPDGAGFHDHTALWDANCIFCHNVKARPGFDPPNGIFAARVEEPGIACEACHGPGGEHVARRSDPLRSALMPLVGGADPTIVSPLDLPPDRQVQLCGHCHGQRLPEPRSRIEGFLTQGDPYTAGEDLGAFTTPIQRDTELEGADFALRFWEDGTPRLTAYEYQALLMTPDYAKGGLTCVHCHSMHGGDPRGMIREPMRGAAACVDCHADIVAKVGEHSRHRAEGEGADCYACHLPRIVYGVLDVHPTHRIARPDPSRAWRYDMPEACTLCHVDRTAEWAARTFTELYGAGEVPAPAEPPPGPFRETAECVRALFAGDVVQRAVAVEALADRAPLWAVPLLLATMEDGYPAVRHFAWRGLHRVLEREGVPAPALSFDSLGDPPARAAALGQAWAWWSELDKPALAHPGPAVPLDDAFRPIATAVARLEAGRDERIIAIGE
jgi:predicted CXXCH cytochrome family protein